MARRGSPEIFSDQGSPVLPVQSAKSFYGTGRKSKNLKATNSTTASTSGSQLRKNKSPGSILSAKTLHGGTGKQPAEPQSRAEKQSGPTEPPRNELPRWCYESQYQYHSSSQSQEENLSGTHSDEEEESVPQSQMEMPSTPQPQWWEMPPASQSQGPETPSVAVSQRKRKTPAGPYAQSVRESYNSDSESESEFERFSKRKRRFTQKEQQSAEHSSMEENIRDMKCTLKLLYEKVEANEKSLKELKAR